VIGPLVPGRQVLEDESGEEAPEQRITFDERLQGVPPAQAVSRGPGGGLFDAVGLAPAQVVTHL
jgi:hypothetical protein